MKVPFGNGLFGQQKLIAKINCGSAAAGGATARGVSGVTPSKLTAGARSRDSTMLRAAWIALLGATGALGKSYNVHTSVELEAAFTQVGSGDTINLKDAGTYSLTKPLALQNVHSVKLVGRNQRDAVLDGGGTTRILELVDVQDFQIKNIAFNNGRSEVRAPRAPCVPVGRASPHAWHVRRLCGACRPRHPGRALAARSCCATRQMCSSVAARSASRPPPRLAAQSPWSTARA